MGKSRYSWFLQVIHRFLPTVWIEKFFTSSEFESVGPYGSTVAVGSFLGILGNVNRSRLLYWNFEFSTGSRLFKSGKNFTTSLFPAFLKFCADKFSGSLYLAKAWNASKYTSFFLDLLERARDECLSACISSGIRTALPRYFLANFLDF